MLSEAILLDDLMKIITATGTVWTGTQNSIKILEHDCPAGMRANVTKAESQPQQIGRHFCRNGQTSKYRIIPHFKPYPLAGKFAGEALLY